MSIALDHIFILTGPEASAADSLVELGLVEGNANVHPGQGTANRRFFLPDFTIEFLYINDADEAAHGAGKGLGLLSRSLDSSASPFGIVVRVQSADSIPDFPNWQYQPDYFNDDICFHVGENSNHLEEPLCICMPPALAKRATIASEYENPDWHLVKASIDTPVKKPSVVLRQFEAMDRVSINHCKPHRLELRFNNTASNTRLAWIFKY